ncbi:hypothetical protein ScPMuIL_011283 [Solemya velum]
MVDKQSGMETAAISVLKRAVELDSAQRFDEAVTCYQEGLQLLMEVLKSTSDVNKKTKFRDKMKQYMDRAEELKVHVAQEKDNAKFHEQIHIAANSTGHTYQHFFGRCLDEKLTEIEVEDPYIRSTHQIYNFLRFCELVVKSNTKVEWIKLTTGRDDTVNGHNSQTARLSELATSLRRHNIELSVEFSNTLHDREIRFNNGWVVKIGRGLDIYKATEGKFVVGFCDFELRHCHETTVDIFYSKPGSNPHPS